MFKTAVTFLMLILCATAWAEDVRSAIEARNQEYADAFNRGDVDSVLALYDEGFIAIPPGSEPNSDRSVARVLLEGAVSIMKDVKLVTQSLSVRGDYAYELGRSSYLLKGEDGEWGPAGDDYFVIWKKDDSGVWNYHVDIWWPAE